MSTPPIIDEKKIKSEFKKKAGKDPGRYYPVEVLIDEGFKRSFCRNCKTPFWSRGTRDVCGEPECSGGYTFIGDSPAKKKMDFIQVWKEFSRLFKKLGYTPIKRYPVAARWRDDTDFVQASIYDFQPYVVSGEIEPPANPLVVPQFCLRFNDIDNVGYTGRHYTGFVMIGQHAFEPPERYSPKSYLRDIYAWLVEGMGIPNDEIQFHEDAWAGGGNMGPSMEFFSRGLEIGNQVYMQYDIRSGTPKELSIKVLDMGMGQERPAWFTHGSSTSYEANFGLAIRRLYRSTGFKPDAGIIQSFLPYSGMLNFDETTNVENTWEAIASRIDIDLKSLKEEVIPLANLYSVADHTRSLLVALTDGALPSNVGGGYNLRTLLRRSLDLISTNSWEVSLIDVCRWHAEYLKPQYPELLENLEEVEELLSVEEKKHWDTRRKSKRIVSSLKGELSLDRLLSLYDSQGVTPQMLVEAGLRIKVPQDFYARVSDRHEKTVDRLRTKKDVELPLEGLERTQLLYYDDYLRLEFSAKVEKILDKKYVVLDKTAFYPTSGGQLHDKGTINKCRVLEVFKQGSVVVHVIERPDFEVGDVVKGRIEKERRVQLAQHHTSTHIVNGVSRDLLGDHIWQAGAEKTLHKARLDITHFEALSKNDLNKIERKANKIVKKAFPVESLVLKRNEAEARYGFRLYQGGAVPGKELRIVSINEFDVEACGGTHLQNTSQADFIKLIGSTKIQDGIVRLEYTAGKAAFEYVDKHIFNSSLNLIKVILDSRLFPDLKADLIKMQSEISGKRSGFGSAFAMPEDLEYIQNLEGRLSVCGHLFSVELENLTRTVSRFIHDIMIFSEELKKIDKFEKEGTKINRGENALVAACKRIFDLWKMKKKSLVKAREKLAIKEALIEEIGGFEVIVKDSKGGADETLRTAKGLSGENRIVVVFGMDKSVSVVALRDKADIDMGALVKEVSKMLGGGGGGRPNFGQGAGPEISKLEEAINYSKERILTALEK